MSETKEEEELQEYKPGPPAEAKGGQEEGEDEEESDEEGEEGEAKGGQEEGEEGEKVSLHSFKRGHLYFTKIKPYLETYSHSYVVSTLKLIEDNDNLLFFTDNSRSVRLFFVDQIVDYQEIPISKKTNTTSRMLKKFEMPAAEVKTKTNASAGSDAAPPPVPPGPPPGPGPSLKLDLSSLPRK